MRRSPVPAFRGNDWWSTIYQTRIMNQFFGDILKESDLLEPSIYQGFVVRPRTPQNLKSSGKSEVIVNDREFEVSLNVSQFKPEELEVKIVDNCVVVHGKHEEKSDAHGFIARELTRKYILPRGIEKEKLTSTLTPGNVLVIQAPVAVLPELPKERLIPVSQEQPQDL